MRLPRLSSSPKYFMGGGGGGGRFGHYWAPHLSPSWDQEQHDTLSAYYTAMYRENLTTV